MHDSRDTVIVTGIGESVEGSDFINYFSRVGEIKTSAGSGRRFALMKRIGRKEREGIVTYVNPESAALAVKTLNETDLKGSFIQVKTADIVFQSMSVPLTTKRSDNCFEEMNTAWRMWMEDRKKPPLCQGKCFPVFCRKRAHDEENSDDVPGGPNEKLLSSAL